MSYGDDAILQLREGIASFLTIHTKRRWIMSGWIVSCHCDRCAEKREKIPIYFLSDEKQNELAWLQTQGTKKSNSSY
jgi:hypothetical protein